MNINTLNKNTENISQTLQALSHPNRILIIMLLSRSNKMTVSEICEKTGLAQPLVSHHVIDMHSKGILGLEKEGRNCFYFLSTINIIKILKLAESIKPN